MSKKAIKSIENTIQIITEADISEIGDISKMHEAIENVQNIINKNKYPITLDSINQAKKLTEDIMLDNTKQPKEDHKKIIKILESAIDSISKGKKEKPIEVEQEIPLDDIDSIIDGPTETSAKLTPDNEVVDIDIELVTEFITESREHIQTAEECLLQLENNPEDMEDINSVFRTFHTMKGIAGFLGLSNIRSITHEAESILDNLRSGKSVITPPVIELFLEVIDHLKVIIDNIDSAIKQSEQVKDYHPDSESLTEKIKNALLCNTNEQSNIAISTTQSNSSIENKQTSTNNCMEAIKVDADKLDNLINMVGELVVAKSMLIHDNNIQKIHDPSFAQKSSQLDKITRELQEVVMSVRMIPLRQTFSKMKRLVRDTAKKSGKEINLIISGEDTEIDKGLVDLIGDPLIHMIRNSVDHGIESLPDRLLADKPEIGTINLKAYQKGGNICIEIQDDGKGLDKDKILSKAKEKQLIHEDNTLSEKEIFNLIFKPGFSTAKQITDISGRGVGMDVVRKNIEEMRGQIDIISSKGVGTTFIIKLPITMAIIDGMVVRVGTEKYIIPILSIKESIATQNLKVTSLLNEIDTLEFHGNQVPILYLEKVFNHKNTELIEKNRENRISVIVEEDNKHIGIMVDELIGQQQVVIKSMDDSIQDCKGISGCAIMPDGTVGLILDVTGILQLSENNRA